MERQSIATSMAPEVIIEQVLGDLYLKGWDHPEVVVHARREDLTMEEQDDVVRVSSRGNCELRVPSSATIRIQSVHGNASLKLLEDQLTINEVLGSFSLRDAAAAEIGRVHGDVRVKDLTGDLHIQQALGDVLIRDVEGRCDLDMVQGNLDLRDVEFDVKATLQGNARIRLSSLCGEDYQIQAQGSVRCRIPEENNLKLILSSQAQVITVRLAEESGTFQEPHHELTLGTGEIRLTISAGGPLYLVSEEVAVAEEEVEGYEGVPSGLPPDFDQQIAKQIEAQIQAQMQTVTRQITEQIAQMSGMFAKAGLSPEQTERIMERARQAGEREAALAQEKLRRAQEKLERKLESIHRREEARAHAAELRRHARGKHHVSFEWTSPPTPPPAPKKPQTTDEERLAILRMLEQKKITLEQAEKLLAALEGEEI